MSGKVEVRDWRVIDIYFNAVDEARITSTIEYYTARGYTLEQITGGAGDFDSCAQMLSKTKITKKKLK